MTDNQQRIQELLGELQHLLKQEQPILIPASAFTGKHTPLQAVALHLSQTHSPKELSRLLLRPKSVIDNALKTAKTKGPLPAPTGPTIDVRAFQELKHTPGEALVYALSKQGLTNKELADAIGQDPRNVWKQLQTAKHKLGGAQ